MAWQFAFVRQTPGGMWLAAVLILTAFLAMGRAQLQLYRCACGRGGQAAGGRPAHTQRRALGWPEPLPACEVLDRLAAAGAAR